MTAPQPIAGTNPYPLAYQNSQFGTDTDPSAVVPSFTVFAHLVNPPQAGVAASASPSILFAENTDPPVGAGGNEPGDPDADVQAPF
jgi:hypothetical protein